MQMRSDLDRVIASGRTVFRFKTNGDENIWTIFAKDEPAARDLLVAMIKEWRGCALTLLDAWKDGFRKAIGPTLDAADEEVLGYIDLHVMYCVLRSMRIDPVGDSKHPDYICDSFTMLSEAFKTSLHDRVAMYRDEFAVCVANGMQGARFEPEHGADAKTGFLTWRVEPAEQTDPPARRAS